MQKKTGNTNGHTLALGDSGEIAVGTQIYEPVEFTNIVDNTYNTGIHGWLYIQSASLEKAEALFATTEFMVSYGTSRQDYVAPSNGTSLTIPFGQTVYGGTASYNGDGTWTVTVEWVSQTYNGTETYGYVASSPYVTIPTSSKHPTWAAGTPICSHFKCGSGLTKPFVQSGNSSTNYWLMLPSDTEWTDADKFKTWVAQQYTNGTPLQIVYKLATPTTFTISNAQLFDALAGRNVMWTDCNILTIEARGTAVTP